jgi:hypothetical protein
VAKYARSFYDVQQIVFPSLRGDMKGMRLSGASEIGKGGGDEGESCDGDKVGE